jgi:3-deoxy-D-manno-octulosonic-acid transferase
MLYWIYNAALTLALVPAVLFLPVLGLMGQRFRSGLPERLGIYGRSVRAALAGARPLWIHAASVGEVLAAKELIASIKARFPERKIVLSTFTTTGREMARQIAGADACVLLPLDHPWFVRRALTVLDPAALVLLETELWPTLLRLCYRRGIPIVLLSGRISPASFRRYFRLRAFFSRVLRSFAAIGMQTQEDAERIERLGADPERVSVTGNLKRAAQPHGAVIKTRAGGLALKRSNASSIVVAGSTHRGEDEILLDAFRELKKKFPALLLVLAPRHPQRFADVERLLKESGVRYVKRTEMNGRPVSDVLFLDTLGELPEFYAIADLAFVGGSLVAAGGHNVLEPARCRKPVFFGPFTANFSHIVKELKICGGGIEVAGKDDLVREIARLLSDPAEARKVGECAYTIARGDRKVVEGSMDLVSRYF